MTPTSTPESVQCPEARCFVRNASMNAALPCPGSRRLRGKCMHACNAPCVLPLRTHAMHHACCHCARMHPPTIVLGLASVFQGRCPGCMHACSRESNKSLQHIHSESAVPRAPDQSASRASEIPSTQRLWMSRLYPSRSPRRSVPCTAQTERRNVLVPDMKWTSRSLVCSGYA